MVSDAISNKMKKAHAKAIKFNLTPKMAYGERISKTMRRLQDKLMKKRGGDYVYNVTNMGGRHFHSSKDLEMKAHNVLRFFPDDNKENVAPHQQEKPKIV